MEVKLAEPDSDRVANPECTDNLHTVAGVEKEESHTALVAPNPVPAWFGMTPPYQPVWYWPQ